MTIKVASGALQNAALRFRGAPGVNYAFVAGPIQNAGSPNFFQPIVVSNHQPTNIDSVTTTSGATGTITVDYTSLGALKVVSFVVAPDETFTINEIAGGASVGLTQAIINTAKAGVQVDPQTLNTTTYPNSNFWLFGVFVVA